MTNVSKEAMKLALTRIAEGNLGDAPWQANYSVIKRIAAEALAEQPAQQEPVAEVKAKMTGGNVGIATVIHEIYSPMRHPLVPGDLLYACPVNQAPVGWMHSRTGLFYSLGVKPDESGLLDEPTDKALPIYRSPQPAQQKMTHQQAAQLINEMAEQPAPVPDHDLQVLAKSYIAEDEAATSNIGTLMNRGRKMADAILKAAPQPAQRTWKKLTDAETEHLWEISRAAIPRYHTFKTLIEKALRERNT